MTAIEFNYHIYQTSKALKPFAIKMTRDSEDAKDLLQDTLIKAFLNREKYTSGTNMKAWLYTIMKNTFITQYQKMMRRNTITDGTEGQYLLNSSDETSHNEGVSQLLLGEINRQLEMIDHDLSEPFKKHYEGYKYHEIAEELNLPIGTVKNRIHLARKELKSRLPMYANG